MLHFFVASKSGQRKGLQKCLVAWKNIPLAVQLAVRGVQAVDRVRSVDNSLHICGKLEDQGEDIPVILFHLFSRTASLHEP